MALTRYQTLLLRFTIPLVGVASSAACSSVPDLVFLDSTGDAGRDAAGEASASSGGPTDARADAPTCSKQEATDTCCGARMCRGDCAANICATCESRCGANEFCCVKGTDVSCRPSTSRACN